MAIRTPVNTEKVKATRMWRGVRSRRCTTALAMPRIAERLCEPRDDESERDDAEVDGWKEPGEDDADTKPGYCPDERASKPPLRCPGRVLREIVSRKGHEDSDPFLPKVREASCVPREPRQVEPACPNAGGPSTVLSAGRSGPDAPIAARSGARSTGISS